MASTPSQKLPATLLDICEPFFQHVCSLNRLSREGGVLDAAQVEAELESLLAEVRTRARQNADTAAAWDDTIERVLIAFADETVMNSKLPFASRYKGMAAKRSWLTWADDVFDYLDAELKQTRPETTQRLEVFYQCLGLGFQGRYLGQGDQIERVLRTKMRELAARIGRVSQRTEEESDRLCPKAYEHTNTEQLTIETGRWLVPIAITLIVLVVAMIGMNVIIYNQSRARLDKHLTDIQAKADKLTSAGKAEGSPN